MNQGRIAVALLVAGLFAAPAFAQDNQQQKPAESSQSAQSDGQSDYCKGWKAQIDERAKACVGSVTQECKTLRDERSSWEMQCN